MSQQPSTLSLLEDLEAIQKSLKKIADSSTEIPTLDEVVEDARPSSLNPSNPFLSSESLSELIQIRNQAEARAARDLAKLGRVKPIEEILETDKEPEPEPEVLAPDPEEIIAKMEILFGTWIEHSVAQYLNVFESELRNHLQQDFRSLVTNWFKEHELPLPESFQAREETDVDEEDSQD